MVVESSKKFGWVQKVVWLAAKSGVVGHKVVGWGAKSLESGWGGVQKVVGGVQKVGGVGCKKVGGWVQKSGWVGWVGWYVQKLHPTY